MLIQYTNAVFSLNKQYKKTVLIVLPKRSLNNKLIIDYTKL